MTTESERYSGVLNLGYKLDNHSIAVNNLYLADNEDEVDVSVSDNDIDAEMGDEEMPAEGEEDVLLNIFNDLRFLFPNLLLIIAPRHMNRIGRVNSMALKYGFNPELFSKTDCFFYI